MSLAAPTFPRRSVHAAFAFCVLALCPLLLAQEKVTQKPSGADTLWEIDQPTVTVKSKVYPQIVFKPGDTVTVTAGGCVQTGGHGSTWKRYVNPSGDNSDRLYHGLIQVPGATAGLVRVSSVIAHPLTVPSVLNLPPGESPTLTLGYEDDGYSDNGYWGHDNGTQNQCAGAAGGPAWIKLLIHHSSGSTPPPVSKAPYDLVWNASDLNGLPMNPRWAKQNDPHSPGLPGMTLCAHPWEAPCTTQTPTIVDLPSKWDILEGNASGFCTLSGPLGKHVNWGVVTYEGGAVWDEHSTGIRGDDDYNFNVWRQDQSAYTQESPNSIHTEFDSDETIDHFHTPWWTAFHQTVDHGNPAPMVNDADIIEVGVLGLDCAHSCGTEIHPVYAMALHIKNDPSDDQWAIFARNQGDEGFCSDEAIQAPDLTTIYFSLPVPPGATGVTVAGGTVFQKSKQSISVQTFPLPNASAPTSFVVQLNLGSIDQKPLVNGELHLRWTVPPNSGLQSAERNRVVRLAGGVRTAEQIAEEAKGEGTQEPEERYAAMVASMPQERQQQILALKKSMISAEPQWIAETPSNLSAPPAEFLARTANLRTKGATVGRLGTLGRTVAIPDQRLLQLHQQTHTILQQKAAATP